MKHMVTYTLKPECVAENERLAAAVYEELARVRPPGVRYATFRLDGGVSFLHLVSHEGAGDNPLTALPAFKTFSAGVRDRCATPPVRTSLTEIGSHGVFD